MAITIVQTPQPGERAEYEKLLKKIFPTKPLYIFLAVSAALLVLMAVQHFVNPSKYSLMFIAVSLLCIVLGGSILFATKKSIPLAQGQLLDSIGETKSYTFTDTQVTITPGDGESVIYPRNKLIGQYCTDRYYIFCFANRSMLIPMVIGITHENIDALNTVVKENNARGVKLKRLKLK